jgi:hypothetical protein
MKRLFLLVASLLCLSGVLHLVKVFAYPIDLNAILAVIVTAVFGLAYLVIGVLMFRIPERVMWAGAVASFLGLLLTLIGMKPNPNGYVIAFILLDLLVVVACAYILLKGRERIHRVG